MLREKFVHILLFVGSCLAFDVNNHIDVRGHTCFPDNFMFGVATASYQIEGAWNASDKAENIWDRYTHTHPERIFDRSTGDVATDSYHRFDEDLMLLKSLGVQHYRFSISWTRVLPEALSNKVSADGIRYYNHMIDSLNRAGIKPLVTMYHWDLPQELQDLGGWTNPVIADYFVDYARVLFTYFGDRVWSWITFNEPLSFCRDGYGGLDAPGTNASGLEDYLCAHNVLRAHGMVYRMYQDEFKGKYNSSVGITLDTPWMEPATTSPADEAAAETSRQFLFGWFAHPIFTTEGDYPPIMRQRIDSNSRKQGFVRSRLPVFTEEEVKMISGSADFLGLNHYTSLMVSHQKGDAKKITPSFDEDMGVHTYQKKEWPGSSSSWLKVVPWGFRRLLNWVKNTYNNPLVYVTENGISLPAGHRDTRRLAYLESYLKNLHDAIFVDKCNVQGYTYWSLLDNFEWTRGYSERFGLVQVDFKSSRRTRTMRSSAAYFTHLAKSKCLMADIMVERLFFGIR